jgi:ATP-dependent Lon protease
LEIVPVKWIDNVLELALERRPEPAPETEEPETAGSVSAVADSQTPSSNLIKH